VPRAPRSLSAEARPIWHRLAPELARIGRLGPLDIDVLAHYCDLSVQVRRAREMLEVALLSRGRRDALVMNPAWRIYRDGLVLLRLYGADLGLSPASRINLPSLPAAPATV
jgi:P27 family predicted phage terminase small subunit